MSYFEKKGTKDFRNSKKFWEFYKSSVKIRSDKSQSEFPNLIIENEISVTDPENISALFNNFFTSIESVSLASKDECVKFTEDLFNKTKKRKEIKNILLWFLF